MTSRLSRREFFKLGSVAAFGVIFSHSAGLDWLTPPGETGQRLVRAIRSQKIFDQPTFLARELGFYTADSVVPILADTTVAGTQDLNPLWLRSDKGWINASYVQSVRQEINIPGLSVPNGGFLAEVTVPFVQVYRLDNEDQKKRAYRLYYACTAWVTSAYSDSTGLVWYRLLDDLDKSSVFAVAKYFRRVQASEVTPISPEVQDKRIEVDLSHQKLAAFENGSPVYTALIASGNPITSTPTGDFYIERKQPIRHMASVEESGGYDLPGVPWVCFISWTGVSFHGTYWHNNYGHPMSHGCINLAPEDARWIYRWTSPSVPIDKDFLGKVQGTKVHVFLPKA